MEIIMKWETVIGLETHVELSTKSKIFCGCTTAFGGEPNTHTCPVCTGQPGSLPVLNRQAVEYAVKAGLVLNSRINNTSRMDRKHYVYPDLPKAYQISQYDRPLCSGGYVELKSGRRINLTRIHIEEDAGKLVRTGGRVMVDYNRGGVPLIEIVSEPDIRSKEEAVEYLEKLQLVLRAAGVSDCRMQEGSMRCDVNISLMAAGASEYGTRCEIKNLNSFVSVAAAIEHEYERQRDILESGGIVEQETRRYDASSGETYTMRGKENADDYRYFREPDIIAVSLTDNEIETLRASLPEMPDARLRRYVEKLGLPESDAAMIVKYRKVSDYFEAAGKGTASPKTVATFIVTSMFGLIGTEAAREEWLPPITAPQLNELVLLMESGKINRNIAKQTLNRMLETGKSATELLSPEELNSSSVDVDALCRKAASENPAAVKDYKSGKEKALKALIGAVMKESRGRAPAADVEAKLIEIIRAI
jgi:aspartyl-tRNA(Asn)/glutamyl-tRNA(Gln) amidotransferase subunit B